MYDSQYQSDSSYDSTHLILLFFLQIIAIIIIIMFYPISIKEEKLMIDQFGDEYRDYMKRTGRFLPRLRQAEISDLNQRIED